MGGRHGEPKADGGDFGEGRRPRPAKAMPMAVVPRVPRRRWPQGFWTRTPWPGGTSPAVAFDDGGHGREERDGAQFEKDRETGAVLC